MAELLKIAKEAVLNEILMKLPEATDFDVVIKDKSNEWVTYNAKVSLMNPYVTPIPIFGVSYTLKTADRVIVSGKMEEHPQALPGSDKTVLEVPVKAAHSQVMSLLEDIGEAWDRIYQLYLDVAIDLPLSAGHTIHLSWAGEIQMPL